MSHTDFPSYRCMINADLCRKIATYCECSDLLQLEQVSKLWQDMVIYQFRSLRAIPEVNQFAYKKHSLFSSDKRICCRLFNLRKKKDSCMYLFGGSFHTPVRTSCRIPDSQLLWSTKALDLEPSIDLPIDLEAATSTTDADGNFLIIGGYKSGPEHATDSVYQFNPRDPEGGWAELYSLCRPRCYGAAVTTIQGDILHVGGGNSPYQGGICYSDCFVRKAGELDWEDCIIPSMNKARCGHAAVTLFDDNIVVLGGYAGGTSFHRSAEMLDRHLNRWIDLPSMSVARSGMYATIGPDGAVYVAGGSANGTLGNKTLERFDPREGKWSVLAEMNVPRGYTTGCDSLQHSGFYVIGGINNWNYSSTMEFYDFRANTWTMVEAEVGSSEWLGRATAHMVTSL